MKACVKQQYETKREALEAISYIKKRIKRGVKKSKSKPHRVYECKCCGRWHTTSQKKR